MKKYFIVTFLSAVFLTNSTYADSITDSWQGEWGYWKTSPQDKDESIGSSISIYNCDNANHTCQFRLDYVGDPNSENGFEHLWGILSIQSNNQALATKFNSFFYPGTVGYDTPDCPGGIQFNLQNNTISITYTKDCQINDVPKLYSFKTHNNYPGRNEGQSSLYSHCYDQNKPVVFDTWCNNPEIFQLDLAAYKIYDVLWHHDYNTNSLVSYLRLSDKEFDQKIEKWRENIIDACKSDPHTLDCLKKNYQQTINDANNFIIQGKKAKEEDDKKQSQVYQELINQPGDPKKAAQIIDKITGVYKYSVKYTGPIEDLINNRLEQILEIVKVDNKTIYFRVALDTGGAHGCDLYGLASYKDSGYFLFDDKGKTDLEKICLFKIMPSANKILLDPVDEFDCRAYCTDTYAGLRNTTFDTKLRRPIRYMDRIKNSDEYKTSIQNH